MADPKHFYDEDSCKGKNPEQVADMISTWRDNEDELADAAFDLLNAIEPWLRNQRPSAPVQIAGYNEQDWE